MKKVEIHIASRNEKSLITDYYVENEKGKSIIEKLEHDNIKVVFVLHKNNTISLCKLYNQILDEVRSDRKDKLILGFVHDDVIFNVESFCKIALEESFYKKWDLLGFAGSTKLDCRKSPLTWFTSSNPTDRYGRVTHYENGEYKESFFNFHSPNTKEISVGAIDGLAMFLSYRAIYTNNIKFDEQFAFDFYDLDFCIRTIIDYGMNIKCLVFPVTHMSVGKSVLTEKFKEYEDLFRKKYYPKYIR